MVGMGLSTTTGTLARVVGGLGLLWEGREHFPFAASAESLRRTAVYQLPLDHFFARYASAGSLLRPNRAAD